MTDHVSITDAADAARLIALGMRPRLLPARDLIYSDLVRRYLEDATFAELTAVIADGLGLVVLACGPQTGLVLAAADQSPFAIKIDEYARRTAFRERREMERVIHGLIHLAVAAVTYPRPDDLANDSYLGRVSVEQVDSLVREACRILDEKAAAAEENNDPLDDAPGLERTWRIYARRPAAATTKEGRLASDSTRSMITKAFAVPHRPGFPHRDERRGRRYLPDDAALSGAGPGVGRRGRLHGAA